MTELIHIESGAQTPDTLEPASIGEHFIDTDSGVHYLATGTTVGSFVPVAGPQTLSVAAAGEQRLHPTIRYVEAYLNDAAGFITLMGYSNALREFDLRLLTGDNSDNHLVIGNSWAAVSGAELVGASGAVSWTGGSQLSIAGGGNLELLVRVILNGGTLLAYVLSERAAT